jgi:Tc toxin complex TcA C-terminal TcB-binding domain
MAEITYVAYHAGYNLSLVGFLSPALRHELNIKFKISTHFHPYATDLQQRLIRTSVEGLQDADTDYIRKADGDFETIMVNGQPQPKPKLYDDASFERVYAPNEDFVRRPFPVMDLDFTSDGAYSIYNWELFFHIPFTLAVQLSKNQRYEEAQRWFHFVFDPTDNSDGPTPDRFWRVRPFQSTDVKRIEELLINLSSRQNPQLLESTIQAIHAWKDAPFRPHVVARYRQTPYMYKTVMAYLDNLIAWGDSLYRQDTGESINEAMQLYVLAANILGPKPQPIPKKGTVRTQTYASLRPDLDDFGNALREIEAAIPFDLARAGSVPTGVEVGRNNTINSIGRTLYFCVPRNDKLLEYWDVVADRLFKIRNSLNLQGVFRQLALFEPPIDPALLARAVAAGVDIAAVVNGTNQPLPLVRFQVMLQKALELCQEVKSFGGSLLSALEKEDSEALSLMRSGHEVTMLDLVTGSKLAQLSDAKKARQGLEVSLESIWQRYTYHEQIQGKAPSEIAAKKPAKPEVSKQNLVTHVDYSVSEKPIDPPPIVYPALATDEQGLASGKKIIREEFNDLNQMRLSRDNMDVASVFDKIGSGLSLIPNISLMAAFLGTGASASYGGSNLASAMALTGGFWKTEAEQQSNSSARAAKTASFALRDRDSSLQSNMTATEHNQTTKQLIAALIREALAQHEHSNHEKQIEHTKQIDAFIRTEKTSNQALYTWMKGEVKNLYSQCFQFAFDIAKKAERALQHELGNPKLSFIQFGYLEGMQGLLAGEKLYLDLKRMEMAYHELNQREYEMIKHVSVLQLDPEALLALRQTGRCRVAVPEALFDMDCPGHYFRRIKTVSITIPCVTGTYTSVNCRLTLQKSSIRTSALLSMDSPDNPYSRTDAEDSRFSDYFGSVQSIVTSSAQNDSGLFETNLRDERYLPFEGSGAVSEWELELPDEFRQFNYDTISDVILHMRYTSREGGQLLKDEAVKNLNRLSGLPGTVRLFSIRHEFPTEWAKLIAAPTSQVTITLREQHYPFWSQVRRRTSGLKVVAFARPATVGASIQFTSGNVGWQPESPDSIRLAENSESQLLSATVRRKLVAPTGPVSFSLDAPVDDLWLAVNWEPERE